jgi:hypothetical protein
MASLRDLDPRFAPLARWFVRVLQSAGVRVTVTSTRRSPAAQAELYRRYKAGLSKYPAAPPGHSTHGLGVAIDLHLEPPVYAQAGALWERLGLTWGGRFNDQVHFDLRPRGRAGW